ncbi:MAG: inositol monophosphatase family protein, partial [Thermodesulfobacteriota bacterium]|nr:inositol monophosphatase family protein [Thermodesulfobacteriota bacterium]
MTSYQLSTLLPVTISAALDAGRAILEIYQHDMEIEYKADKSPLTAADRASHEILSRYLKAAPVQIPILSEEGRDIPFTERREWETFWLVDPLDGTKEFIKHNGEFTVNIALVQNGSPQLGIIYVPVKDTLYF